MGWSSCYGYTKQRISVTLHFVNSISIKSNEKLEEKIFEIIENNLDGNIQEMYEIEYGLDDLDDITELELSVIFNIRVEGRSYYEPAITYGPADNWSPAEYDVEYEEGFIENADKSKILTQLQDLDIFGKNLDNISVVIDDFDDNFELEAY